MPRRLEPPLVFSAAPGGEIIQKALGSIENRFFEGRRRLHGSWWVCTVPARFLVGLHGSRTVPARFLHGSGVFARFPHGSCTILVGLHGSRGVCTVPKRFRMNSKEFKQVRTKWFEGARRNAQAVCTRLGRLSTRPPGPPGPPRPAAAARRGTSLLRRSPLDEWVTCLGPETPEEAGAWPSHLSAKLLESGIG